MPTEQLQKSQESAWMTHLSRWSGYELPTAADWGRLIGLQPNQLVWRDLTVATDGLRLEFQSSQGVVWADLCGTPSTRLMVTLRWQLDHAPVVLHGAVLSQYTQTHWSLAEPIVINNLPAMIISIHDWYDKVFPKIYHSRIDVYVRNFYRLLLSPAHQFHLLHADHLANVAPSWRDKLLVPSDQDSFLDRKTAEDHFLNIILPKHPDFSWRDVSRHVDQERHRLLSGEWE